MPRIPCRTFAGFWERPSLIKDFMRAGRPGSYLRIVQEGDVGAGDAIEILYRPTHGITISDLFAAENGERSKISEIAKVPELSDEYREWAEKVRDSN
jgi:MOSC domain-containing protein YiiM